MNLIEFETKYCEINISGVRVYHHETHAEYLSCTKIKISTKQHILM